MKIYFFIFSSRMKTRIRKLNPANAFCVVRMRKKHTFHSPQIVTHFLLYRHPNYVKIITFKDKPDAFSPRAHNVTSSL